MSWLAWIALGFSASVASGATVTAALMYWYGPTPEAPAATPDNVVKLRKTPRPIERRRAA
jgi:hypothetical protein